MSDELHRAVKAIRDMEKAISRLESRLDRVEHAIFEHPVEVETRPVGTPHDAATEPVPPPSPYAINSVLIGRSLIVFGGAYLLRALTESGAFPIMVGALAGLVYAGIFLLLAFRQASDRRSSATFHGMMAVLIAMPLAVETTVGFREWRPDISFLIILLYCAVTGSIAVMNRLRALTWIVQAVAVGSLIALIVGSRSWVLGMIAFLLIAVGSLMAARHLSISSLIFLPAVFSTLLVLPIADLAVVPDTPPGSIPGLLAILTFLSTWVVSLMVDSWSHEDRPGPGMLLQLFVVVLIGVGAALFVSEKSSLSFLFAPITSVLALLTGACAWRMIVRAGDRDTRSVTFVIVTTLLLMAVTGSILPPAPTAVTWLVLAALSVLPARIGHPLMYTPPTVLLVGAAFTSGLITWISRAMIALPDPSSLIPPISAIATVATSAAILLTTPREKGPRRFFHSMIDATTTTILIAGAAGFAIHLLQLSLPSVGAAVDDPGAVAAVRTIVLSVAAVFLAWLARYPRSRTTGALVNPVLILIAVLIITVNVRVGRAATHFPAFSVYGLALIIAPALKRRSLAMRRKRSEAITADESTVESTPETVESSGTTVSR